MKRFYLDRSYNTFFTFTGNEGMSLNSSQRLGTLYGEAI